MKKSSLLKTIIGGLIGLSVIILAVWFIFADKVAKPKEWSEYVQVLKTAEEVLVPIPDGFINLKITNKLNEGIVIQDNDGNQFVWVPIADGEFKRETFGLESTPLGYQILLVKEEDKNIKWENISNPSLKQTFGGIWEPDEEEYKELVSSVAKYGGFYMGRYQASYVSGNSVEDYIPAIIASTVATEERGNFEAGRLWNFVSANEAYLIAKNMYKDNKSVVSHLPYGIEWDTTLRWFINSGEKSLAQINEDSSSWGNTYNDTFSNTVGIANTGKFVETSSNNIYDMAGNMFEWTREYFIDQAINRGGNMRSYNGEPSFNLHAASRTWMTQEDNNYQHSSVGFRVALYIK